MTLCEDVIAGLRYLHQNGLVYCNLDRSTVAHIGDRWALCDYSQLRPEGNGYAGETRRLMGSIAGAPPEAFSGIVTPTWDTWSLAHLIELYFKIRIQLANFGRQPAPAGCRGHWHCRNLLLPLRPDVLYLIRVPAVRSTI